MLRVKVVWDGRFIQNGTIYLTVVLYHRRQD